MKEERFPDLIFKDFTVWVPLIVRVNLAFLKIAFQQGFGDSGWGKGGLQVWVGETQFILAALCINYSIIFQTNNCEPTLPHRVYETRFGVTVSRMLVEYSRIERHEKQLLAKPLGKRYFCFAIYTTNELVSWVVNEYVSFPMNSSLSHQPQFKNSGIEKTFFNQICSFPLPLGCITWCIFTCSFVYFVPHPCSSREISHFCSCSGIK